MFRVALVAITLAAPSEPPKHDTPVFVIDNDILQQVSRPWRWQ
jgi:hypothetical protein